MSALNSEDMRHALFAGLSKLDNDMQRIIENTGNTEVVCVRDGGMFWIEYRNRGNAKPTGIKKIFSRNRS